MERRDRERATRRDFVFGAAFGATLCAAGSVEAQRVADFIPSERLKMEAAAEDFAKKYSVPALSVAIAYRERLCYAGAFGMADADKSEKLTPQHRFRIASVSKPITAVTIMKLVEQGRLRLTDRVFGENGILGTAYGKRPYGRNVERITVDHLLTHSAGGWDNQGPEPDPMFLDSALTHARLIAWTLDHLPLKREPGEKYAYSNFGFCLLGRIIEKITGASYEQYVRDNVLRVCGIKNMQIAGNTLAERAENEVVYVGQSGENPYNMNVRRMDSHGGWIATPTDLVRLLVRTDGFDARPDILRLDTVTSMTEPSKTNAGYARGWCVNRAYNWWHNGSLPGTTTIMVRTSSGFCWAALANTRRPGSPMDGDLDRLIWEMVGKVTRWPGYDLFKSLP